MTTKDAWAARLRESHTGAYASIEAHRANIRAAYASKEMTLGDIARALDTDRRAVRIQLETADHEAPTFPTTVHLSAPGRGGILWGRMDRALSSRGYVVTGSEDACWHLSRAGVTIVRVNLDCVRDDDPVYVGVHRAVFRQPLQEVRVVALRDYLPTMESIRFEREHPEIAEWPVHEHFDNDIRWKVERVRELERKRVWDAEAANHGGGTGAYVIDVQYIADKVDEILGVVRL